MKALKIVMIIMLVSLAILYGVYNISKSRTFQFFDGLIDRVETDTKIVALTFDDGPTKYTEEVLQILAELDVKATFFVTGRELDENDNYGKQIVDAGHSLGNHTYNHPRMMLKSYDVIKEEIDSTTAAIRHTGYQQEIFFRPPGCKKLFFLPYYLRRINMTTITWDLEPDSIREISGDAQAMIDYVLENVRPGSIILMHVMYEGREPSRQALPAIVYGLRERGYRFVLLPELLSNSTY